jgi:hypothetical protein
MKVLCTFGSRIILHVLFFLTTLGVCIAQTDFITSPVYQTNGSDAYPNQKAIAVGSDGFVRFVTGDSSSEGSGDAITFVRCLDENCSTLNTKTVTTGNSTDDYSMALGPDGYARIAYSVFGGPNVTSPHESALGFIQCSDADCSSFTNTIVDQASDNGVASIAVGDDGTSYIVYDWGDDRYGPQGVGMATCNGGSCSTSQIAEISIYDAITGAIAIGSDGNPVVAYVDDTYDTDRSVHYYENGTDTVISNDVGGYDEMDLTIAPDGFARIIFPNSAADDGGSDAGANFIQCTNASCSSRNTNTISTAEFGTGYASGATGEDGKPQMEVFGGGAYPGLIDYVRCGDASCSSYITEEISGNWNGIASLALGTDGGLWMLAQNTDNVAYQVSVPCPTSVTLSTTTQLSLENNFPQFETGIGILTAMQVNPATKADGTSWNGTQITEDVHVNNIDTCPSSVQACNGHDTFTVGTGSGTTFGQPFSAEDNIFWDEHARAASTSLLNAPGVTTTSCTSICSQTYQCHGHTIGSFTIVYGLSTGIIDGTPVTNVSVTKQ